MKILYKGELAASIRNLSDSAQSKIWIAVPYIGSWSSVVRILGNSWLNNPLIDVRLITDMEERNGYDGETMDNFIKRAAVRHLAALHAKVYIFDEKMIITSANLTKAGFSKRHEIGVLLEGQEFTNTLDIFMDWWEKSSPLTDSHFYAPNMRKQKSREENETKRMPDLFDLPPAQKGSKSPSNAKGGAVIEVKGFARLHNIYEQYKAMARDYQSIQSLWRDVEPYLETDAFLNYLFHEEGSPSNPFSKSDKKPRKFARPALRKDFLKQKAKDFAKYAKNEPKYNSSFWKAQKENVQRLLTPVKSDKLTLEEIKEILEQTNAMRAYYPNITKVLNPQNNLLVNLQKGLKLLVSEEERPITQRMAECDKIIDFMGASTICEIVANLYPSQYPKINTNSLSGLRYLGYDVPVGVK
jgi:hypothetical protein